MSSKKTVTIPHYLKRSVDTEGGAISESDLNLWKNRLNSGMMKYIEIKWPEDGEGFKLTREQNEKGYNWLMDQWKTKSGAERKNNPFGYREQDALENFKEIRLIDFYDTANYYKTEEGFHFYVPYYRVLSKDGRGFEYEVHGGQVNILG